MELSSPAPRPQRTILEGRYVTMAPLDAAAQVRVLPDGGVLVATAPAIVRLDASGALVRTYGLDAWVSQYWLGLDLAGDGTFWYPKNPKVTNYWYVTYASVFGDDPSPQVKALIGQMKKIGKPPATGGFITGASVIDGIAAAVEKAHGSTDGATLARVVQGFHNLPTISGKVSFSAKLHSVFGRAYRIIEVQNSKPKFVQLYTTKKLGSL